MLRCLVTPRERSTSDGRPYGAATPGPVHRQATPGHHGCTAGLVDGRRLIVGTAKPGSTPHCDHDETPTLTPPDQTGMEAWIRQVLRLAGPRVSSFVPPSEPPGEADPPPTPDGP